MTNTKPATPLHTPLPWTHREGGNAYYKIQAGNRHVATVWTDGRIDAKPVQLLPVEANAAYIVHACNAYPELVRELRLCNVNEQGEQKRNTVIGRLLAKLGDDK